VDTGVGAGDISRWYREYAIPVMTRYGLEVTFCLPLNARDVAVMLTVWDGALVHTYQVRWRQITGELLVHDSTGADHIVATLGALFADSETWYSLKLVVDPLSDVYTRIIFNSATYDVSDVAVATGPFVTSPGVQVSFGGSSDLAAARVFYFDSAIFTMNE
jgi:hypothetical protein